ncbi:MAG: hypothetical protein ACYDHP_03490 [Ferrimicrobium sp.]
MQIREEYLKLPVLQKILDLLLGGVVQRSSADKVLLREVFATDDPVLRKDQSEPLRYTAEERGTMNDELYVLHLGHEHPLRSGRP